MSDELKPLDSLTKLAETRCKNMIEKGIVSQGKRRNLLQEHGENMVLLCDAVRTNYTAKDAIMNWFVVYHLIKAFLFSDACDMCQQIG